MLFRSGALPESQIKAFLKRLGGPAAAQPSPIDLALEEAKAALDAGDVGTASALYSQVLAREPGNAVAAAGLAKADLWESGWAAMKVGAAGFVVPFMFVYEPALLLIGDPWVSARAFVTAFVGCISLAAGLHGYFLGPASRWQPAS